MQTIGLKTVTLDAFMLGQGAVNTPVMCSDVVVYPYQIYQARLAGADALKLVAPALPSKVRGSCYVLDELNYLSKEYAKKGKRLR